MVNKSRLYWTLQILGWSFYALVEIITSALASDGQWFNPKRFNFLLFESLCCLLLTHGLRVIIIRRNWLSLGLASIAPRIVISVLLLGLLMYFIRIPATLALDMFRPEIIYSAGNVLGLSFVYAVIFFLWSVLYFVYNYFERYNNSLKMEASLREIELNNLKSQLNPHFIFNALNSIRALVDENPGKSKQAITQLSGLLRSSLNSAREQLTPLREELRIVQDYLGLETIRFEERLRSKFDIDPSSENFLVPPLMLQTVVENGIKHGISKLTQGGNIQLTTRLQPDHLLIQIRNSGSLKNGMATGGLGLENTRQRLRLIYGEKASLRIQSEQENIVLTEIYIPT